MSDYLEGNVTISKKPLWFHEQGLSYTASGYGTKIPSQYVATIGKRTYRIYIIQKGNAGSAYILMKGKRVFLTESQMMINPSRRNPDSHSTAKILINELGSVSSAIRYAEKIARNARNTNPVLSREYADAATILKSMLRKNPMKKRRNPETSFHCDDCGKTKPVQTSGGSGYGTTADGKKFCYECAGKQDVAYMREHGKIDLYLTKDGNSYKITNWPGTLKFLPVETRKSYAAAYGRSIPRLDAWFTFEGYIWHCVQKGNMDLCRCRKTKLKLHRR